MLLRPSMFGLLTSLALGVACDQPQADDPEARFLAVLPTRATLALEVPGEDDLETAAAPLDIVEAPLLGSPSSLKQLTGVVRRYLVTVIDNVTDGVQRLTATRPVIRTDEVVVWRLTLPGPSEERALVMRKLGGHYVVSSWVRALGPAGQASAPWRFLLFGRITPGGSGPGQGRGVLWINLDNDGRPRSHGLASVAWSKIEGRRQIEIMLFDGTPDEGEIGRLTRGFRFEDGPDGGLLAFDAGDIDVHLSPDKPLPEHVRVLTRWNAAHVLRSDYAAVGPEVRADGFRALIGSECWQVPGATVTFEARIGVPIGGGLPVRLFERGDPLTCGFPAAEAPVVAPLGSAPIEPELPVELETP